MLSLPSSSISRQKYDVFLSFRGEDTRNTFTDHLHADLERNGIVTFRDDPKLEAGEEIAPELFKAIQESWCSLIVFSKTYAFSGWCLDELAEIVKQKNERGHKIFPIFYDVDPSDLRKQTRKVEEAFAKHGTYKENKDKIQRWRKALTEVANIKGWHSNNGPESEFIKDIVKKISEKMRLTYANVPDGLIGINSRLEMLNSKIDIGEDYVRIVGICGMGGIGKTTLARVVYTQMSHKFEGKSFLADVREASEKHGLVFLQTQLLSDILGKGFNLFSNVCDGNAMISQRLSRKKVLIVIDDVDNLQHLKCLVGRRDWFGLGSRIIVTTRDEQLLRSYQVDDVYKPATLTAVEALRLFSLKAFNSDTMPENDFVELSKRVVKYVDGLPLALEVLGCFLCGRDVAQWRSAIERLKRDSCKEILDRLQIGYDGLEETEKNIFLDIACFFNGEEKDFVMTVLDGCEFFPDIGIDVLVKKSLLKVDEFNKRLRMHDLLQEMGRKIVRQKCLDEPGKRCRLWEQKDVYHILTRNTATETIEGMVIDNKGYKNTATKAVEGMIIDNGWEQDKTFTLSVDAFSKMKKLRLLRMFSYQQNSSDHLKYLSNDLRLLDWSGYPFRSLSSSFQPSNLVALLIPYSHIERLWEENTPLCKLKWVNLKGSQNLIKTPDFTMASNLESLILEDCTKVIDVHPSIGVLRRLKLLNLRGCKSLRILPSKIGMESLETLILSGCSNLQMFPEIDGKMECLLEICLDGTGITKLPSSFRYLSKLKLLNLKDCRSLRSLPTKIIGMESLEKLILSCCSNFERFPEIDGEVKCLLELHLDGTGIEELPSSIRYFTRLKLLNLRDCKSLRSLPSKITGMKSLEQLILSDCSNLERFPEIDDEMECLLKLNLDGTGIKELPSSIGHLSNLVLLNLKDCSNLVSLPSNIDGCKCLKTLNLSGCSKLETLPENLQQVEFLEELDLSETAISKPPSFVFQFKNLKVLSFKGCKAPPSKLQRGSMDSMALMLPPLSGLTSLKKLNLSDCNFREGTIPSDICCLSSLETLNLSGNKFVSLPATLTLLSKLRSLLLSECKRLKSLPDFVTRIENVNVDGCASLEVIAKPSTVRNSFDWPYISGINCYRLAEKNNALTMLKEYIKAIANKRQKLDILIPGSEIPEWFNRQRYGSSINMALPPNIQNDSQWMGVALCCVFVSAFCDDDAWEQEEKIFCKAVIHGSRSRIIDWSGLFIGRKCRRQQVMKDHLWLRYWSRDSIFPFSLKNECGDETENLSSTVSAKQECNEIEFSTQPMDVMSAWVKKCGVRMVYEKDLEEMEEIQKQHSSPTNCADLDDIHQDITDDHGLTGNDGVFVKRKLNIYEEVGPNDQSNSPKERSYPKYLERILNFIMGRKINSG